MGIGSDLELVDRARDLGLDVPRERRGPPKRPPKVSTRPGGVTADAQILARDEPTASDANAYWSLTTDVRRRVGEPVLRWRRWLAWANPRSIFP
jgi:hypothetical protein